VPAVQTACPSVAKINHNITQPVHHGGYCVLYGISDNYHTACSAACPKCGSTTSDWGTTLQPDYSDAAATPLGKQVSGGCYA